MEITIILDDNKTKIILKAITNVSTSVSASGLKPKPTNPASGKKGESSGSDDDIKDGPDVSRINKNFSFTAYLDDTGMLYDKVDNDPDIRSTIDLIQDGLMNVKDRIPRVVTFASDTIGIASDHKFLMTSFNTTFELMSNEGKPLRAKVDFSFAQEFEPSGGSSSTSKDESQNSQSSTQNSQESFNGSV
ncbi:hypothetical protein [Flammeovirga sp. SJP92]|uniref:CIS tube protein n=1 Tax=Flammeovirga sp. SJP92 TaxID=1775430 RepID=UPI0007873D8C|nr:hypothetical protein [Flammeovirga sp. SJP92]KXX68962.1 hypothetical protein AVL50_17530 [Flammeovirga sp. SJP92]